MSQPTRWILVDDVSPDIKYAENSWFARSGNPLSNEVSGLPYQNTLHGTNSTSSLTYNFTGSAVRVKGTAQLQGISGTRGPTWECSVDGTKIDNLNGGVISDRLNNFDYCEVEGLNDGPHTLSVTAAVTSPQTFWIDRIEYVPSPGISLEDKTLLVSSYLDPALQYSFGWNDGRTDILRASLTFEFVGTSLIWYTQYNHNYSSSRTTATWSIEASGAEEHTVTLPEFARGSNLFNQILFDTGTLGMGTHRLKVTHNGVSSGFTPLTLSYLVIQNGTISAETGSALTPTNSNSRGEAIKIGAAVGGIVALFTVAIVILFCIYRRRRNSRRFEKEYFKESTPYVESPNLRYTYHAGQDGQMAGLVGSRTHPAVRAEDPANGQITLVSPIETPPVQEGGAVLENDIDVPEGAVIDLPPAYSLT